VDSDSFSAPQNTGDALYCVSDYMDNNARGTCYLLYYLVQAYFKNSPGGRVDKDFCATFNCEFYENLVNGLEI
jgi:hypothetical protein